MRMSIGYLVAATLAVGGAGLLMPTLRAADPAVPGGATVAPADQTGAMTRKPADESVARDVRRTLARVVNDGYTRGSFDDLVGYLSKDDRDRIGKVAGQKFDDLDAKIDQFRKDFRAKYNQDFDIKEEQLSGIQVYQGADKTHVLADISSLNVGAGEKLGAKIDEKTGGMATKTGMMEPVMLSLVNEGNILNAWRIDIPNSITGSQLKDNLLRHITMVDDAKDTWPSDVTGGYKLSAWHLFAGLNVSPMASEK